MIALAPWPIGKRSVKSGMLIMPPVVPSTVASAG
jgi:hypothetical protein